MDRRACYQSLWARTIMKINFIGTNPPYKGQSRVHQQFFNRAVDLIDEGGQVAFLQPATVYFNKKEDTDNHSQLMRDNIKRYKTATTFINPRVFDNAVITNDLSITILTKIDSNEEIESVTYVSGAQYNNVKLENVTKTEMNPFIYEKVAHKYKSYINNNGSILDIATWKPNTPKVKIAYIRGNNNLDWFTFIPNDDIIRITNDGYGIPTNNSIDNTHNIVYNLKLKSMRFGLSLYKFSSDLHGGAMQGVPLIDLSKKHTDVEVYDLLGITDDEQREINRVIPEYYDKKY
jgi:DNA gyrase/topoisomerase IV subunit B